MNRLLENSVVRLLKKLPFYGQILLNCRRVEGAGGHPLGVTIISGTPVLKVDPDGFGEFTAEEQEGLLEHGIKHLLHLHMGRCKGRNRHDWDIACDMAINPTISCLPADAVLPERFGFPAGLAAEEY